MTPTENVIAVIALGLACGQLAWLVTRAKITKGLRNRVEKAGVRRQMAARLEPTRATHHDRVRRTWEWLGELLSCPYCAAHWPAVVVTLVWRPRLTDLWLPLDLLVSGGVVVVVAMAAVTVIRTALEKR